MQKGSACLLGAALLASVLSACRGDELQDCPPIDHTPGANVYQLEYELTIPSKCPVPIGARGEEKTAGARIFDNGAPDFTYAEVVMQNSERELLVRRLFRFVSDGGRYGAVPRTTYKAATGSYGGFNLNNKFDYGIFAVTNNAVQASAQDPFGQVQITYTASAMLASVGGPTIPLSNSTHTWMANASGGIAPYTYNWYRNGTWVGNGSTYTGATGTQDFNLLAEVTDAAMVVRKGVMPVDVDGVLVSISGPTMVYSSQNGGTWTASGQGGQLPYEFDWFIDGVHVSTGNSLSTYTGEGWHQLGVRIRDASGTSHEAFINVVGIGNETCEPVPPAVAC
jgi:hypothetical protein